MKFVATEPEDFQRRLEEKINALVKKFRNEANNSKTKMMTYAMSNFEAATKVILSDGPNLYDLIKSSKDLVLTTNGEISEWVSKSCLFFPIKYGVSKYFIGFQLE